MGESSPRGRAGPPRFSIYGLVALAAVALAGCAGSADRADPPYATSADFPLPPGLEDNVTFWKNVYTRWSRDKVVIHDDRYMGVIYQVATLPGAIEDIYTPAQRDYVRALRERWSDRLRALERRVAAQGRLGADERALKDKLDAAGGPGAVFGAAERVRSQRGVRERYYAGLERSGRWLPAFREVFRRHGLPEDLALLPHVESSFVANARSSAGASGMWQFIRSTGRGYMTVNGVIDERLDPIIAADAAARYLKNSYAKLRDWPLALTSYNHGLGGMQRAKARHGTDFVRIVREYDGRYFGFASRNFYAQFLAARHVADNADAYFPEGIQYQAPFNDHPVKLRFATSIDDLALEYRVPRSALAARNLAWQDSVRSGARPVPAGTTVWVPAGASRIARGLSASSAFR
jgi:membrane-bound lytic murein transglycosylase D